MAIGYSPRMKVVARIAVTAAIAAGVLSACSQADKDKEAPTSTTDTTITTTTTTTEAPASSPEVTPSEKGGPTKGGSKFTPSVLAPRPQTAVPGNIITAPH